VPQSASYPADLARLMAQAHSSYRVINRGVSGDTTTDALQRLPAVIALHPRWVILEFGGNDGLRGLPLSTTRAHLQSMILALQKAGIHVLLVGMTLPPNYGAPYVRAFQQIFPSLAAQDQVPLLPVLYQDLIPRLRTDPGLLQDDGIHASVRGNTVVAETVWHALRPLLKK
jgi:acyl-CoA thioesterase I